MSLKAEKVKSPHSVDVVQELLYTGQKKKL